MGYPPLPIRMKMSYKHIHDKDILPRNSIELFRLPTIRGRLGIPGRR